jgi:hypothetical protein
MNNRRRSHDGTFDFQYKDMLTREFLERKYLQEKLSASQIAHTVGCCKWTVREYLRRHNIARRLNSYALHLRYAKSFQLTDEVKNYVDGLVLGDGHIFQKNKWSARYDQGFSARFRGWAFRILQDFHKFGIEGSFLETVTKDTIIKKTGQHLKSFLCIMLYTKFYETFTFFRKRWYVNGIKVIPRDIELTPQLLANFHMGDGEHDLATGRVAFSVNSFCAHDVKFLVKKLQDTLGVEAKVYPNRGQDNQPRIKLSRKDSEIFLSYTKLFKVSCFNYKWGIRNE